MKPRVVGYCRVSTDYAGQIESNDHQIEHAKERIMKNPEWEFAGIYADPAYTGTNDNLEDQYYIDNHHDPLVGRILWEKIGQMIKERKLAGQHDFTGIEDVRKLAKRDHMLDEVRMYLPRTPGRWVALRERRLGGEAI